MFVVVAVVLGVPVAVMEVVEVVTVLPAFVSALIAVCMFIVGFVFPMLCLALAHRWLLPFGLCCGGSSYNGRPGLSEGSTLWPVSSTGA